VLHAAEFSSAGLPSISTERASRIRFCTLGM